MQFLGCDLITSHNRPYKVYTLWGLSCLGIKVEHWKWSNVSFIVIFSAKVSCILKSPVLIPVVIRKDHWHMLIESARNSLMIVAQKENVLVAFPFIIMSEVELSYTCSTIKWLWRWETFLLSGAVPYLAKTVKAYQGGSFMHIQSLWVTMGNLHELSWKFLMVKRHIFQ